MKLLSVVQRVVKDGRERREGRSELRDVGSKTRDLVVVAVELVDLFVVLQLINLFVFWCAAKVHAKLVEAGARSALDVALR